MTRATAALLLLAAPACATRPLRPAVPAEQYLLSTQSFCFDTESGLLVYVVPPCTCPDADAVERAAERALRSLGADPEDVFGTRVVYVPTFTRVGGREADGVSFVDARGADVLVTQYPDDWWTLRHEFGHVIRFRCRGDADGGHRDCVFWRRLEGRDCGVWGD